MFLDVKGRITWIVVLILVAAAGGAWYRHARASRVPEPKFVTVPAERGHLTARVTATGTLSALVTVQVGSQVSGRISQLFADYNSPVKKGQVIAKIDPQLFTAAVEQTKANVAVQEGQVEQAKVNAKNLDLQRQRTRTLRQQNLVAQADLDTAEAAADAALANVKVQQAQLQQARASLHQAQVNLDYTTIISPTDGTVISRNVDVGQTVAASLQAPVLFTIAQDLTKMQVDTSVAEADVGKLHAGMTSSFTVDAYPSVRFHGKVRQIRNAPQTVQNVVTYDAVIDVDNSDLKLKPGMTANVTFVYAERDDALKVPNAALRFRPAPSLTSGKGDSSGLPGLGAGGGKKRHEQAAPDQRTLYVLRDNQPLPVEVKVGVSDGTTSEILEGGLKPGDRVITESAGERPGGPPTPFRRGPF